MFIDNKYTKIYFKLVSSISTDTYTENHHIIPRCLGGTDEVANIASISARKHFLCHYLLIKMTTPNSGNFYKMVNAFMMMRLARDHQKRYFNSRIYSYYKETFSKIQSANQIGTKNSQYGTVWIHCPLTLISKHIKLSELPQHLAAGCEKGRITKKETYIQRILKPLPQEITPKEKRKCAACGTLTTNPKFCSIHCSDLKKITTKGYKHTEESKIIIQQKAKQRQKLKCVHCGAEQASNTINRYHNDNCKFKMVEQEGYDPPLS